jgi:hypothetical protein
MRRQQNKKYANKRAAAAIQQFRRNYIKFSTVNLYITGLELPHEGAWSVA